MYKLAVAAATFGILSIGGIAASNAQYYEAGPTPNTVYVSPGGTVYEGRNVYTGPGTYYNYEPNTQGARTAQDFMNWKMPGDQAIINQQRANERSSR